MVKYEVGFLAAYVALLLGSILLVLGLVHLIEAAWGPLC